MTYIIGVSFLYGSQWMGILVNKGYFGLKNEGLICFSYFVFLGMFLLFCFFRDVFIILLFVINDIYFNGLMV